VMKSRYAAYQGLSDNIKTDGAENAGSGVEGRECSQGRQAVGDPSGHSPQEGGIAGQAGVFSKPLPRR